MARPLTKIRGCLLWGLLFGPFIACLTIVTIFFGLAMPPKQRAFDSGAWKHHADGETRLSMVHDVMKRIEAEKWDRKRLLEELGLEPGETAESVKRAHSFGYTVRHKQLLSSFMPRGELTISFANDPGGGPSDKVAAVWLVAED